MPFIMERLKLSQLTYKLTRSMSDGTLRKHVEQVRKKRESTPPPSPKASFTLGSPTNEGPRRRFSRITTQGNQHLLDLLEVDPSYELSLSNEAITEFPLGDDVAPLPSAAYPRVPTVPRWSGTEPSGAGESNDGLSSTPRRLFGDIYPIWLRSPLLTSLSTGRPLCPHKQSRRNKSGRLQAVQHGAETVCQAGQRHRSLAEGYAGGLPVRGSIEEGFQVLGVAGVMVNCTLIGQSGLVHRLWPDLTWGGQVTVV